jgi:hypothetical protein
MTLALSIFSKPEWIVSDGAEAGAAGEHSQPFGRANRLRFPMLFSGRQSRFRPGRSSADLAHSPATCRVATLSRFQTLIVAMASIEAASAGSSFKLPCAARG